MFRRLLSALPELCSAYAGTVGLVMGADVFADFLILPLLQGLAISGTLIGILGRSPIVKVIKDIVCGEDGGKPANGG